MSAFVLSCNFSLMKCNCMTECKLSLYLKEVMKQPFLFEYENFSLFYTAIFFISARRS